MPENFRMVGRLFKTRSTTLSRYGKAFVKRFNEASKDETEVNLLFNDVHTIRDVLDPYWALPLVSRDFGIGRIPPLLPTSPLQLISLGESHL